MTLKLNGHNTDLSMTGDPVFDSSRTTIRVLVIDDERNIRATLKACLEAMGCIVGEAANRQAALRLLRQARWEMAFLDLRLGEEDGLEAIPDILAENPSIEIIVITAFATIQTAVKAIRLGAKDYLPKPFEPAQIRRLVERTRELRDLERRVSDLSERLTEAAPDIDLSTQSQTMRSALEVLKLASASDASVLLKGENGTGKTVFARSLHAMSARAGEAFVVVNCPTLSEELLSSELFGHARGAFTGALRDQPGKVEAAEGGTLFLDEISEIPVNLQAKLLRFLQEKQFERIGETRTRKADVRVVAATNRNLDDEIAAGRFREDLFYRLNVVEITVPPLRERQEDIVPLSLRFAAFFAQMSKRPTPELAPSAKAALENYPWPGNVRELRNAMERALILWPSQVIEARAFPGKVAGHAPVGLELGGDFTLEEIEAEHIRRVLGRAATMEEASRVLGIDVSTLWRKRKRLGAN